MAQRQIQGGQQGNYGGNRNYGPAAGGQYAFNNSQAMAAQQKAQQNQNMRQGQPNLAGPMTYAQRVRYPPSESAASSSSGSSAPASRPVVMTVNRKPEDDKKNKPLSPPVAANTVPTATRPQPDRYKRSFKKTENNPPAATVSSNGSALPSGSGMAAIGALYTNPPHANSQPSLPRGSISGSDDLAGAINAPFAATLRSQSVDDIHTYQKPVVTTQHNLQNRRRSFGAFQVGAEAYNGVITDKEAGTGVYRSPSGVRGTAVVEQIRTVSAPRPIQIGSGQQQNTQRPALRPGTVVPIHSFQGPAASPNFARRGSAESTNSASSNQSPRVASGSSSRPSSARTDSSNNASNNADPQIPPRSSSADANRRINGPSPLSKPMTMNPDPNTYQEFPKPTNLNSDASNKPATPPQSGSSPAAEHLAALSLESKKGLKNRLRRALSFGSAAELRRAAANGHAEASRHGSRGHSNLVDEDPETARIARQQEAAGLGEGIYNGQGNIFMGSTDNISVSSTASSASVMLRKMGKGMKRSTRSLVGLFRPKSAIGLSSKSSSTELSVAQVTVVNVEAEQQRANVNADPHDQVGGGTGFPKLGHDGQSVSSRGTDSTRLGTAREEDIKPRSSGGVEKERQDIQAVRKGILKRAGSSSPIVKAQKPDFQLPTIGDNTKTEINIDGENYVISEPHFTNASGSNSAPTTPKMHPKYEVVFSPRITFHETWTSGEYDRKGDIATCNRLTPMLAQQIKEELNTFKMEMDVHEESRVYTHFF
ncbi:hypothetical protein BJ508DRAFT_301866 [Ascobolus immersus RN42]|uniref:Protein BNI4 n=1 Tax=Ascobolus immersus RN42 TaxID=1160509 RepID=A0A3N4IXW3_ASCIM|nr:hypothetical protein BJ508DRAFT_301866 [Ascobolus immersus RN42]